MVSIMELVNISPSILTIAPTHKCTASCSNCCFGCTPHIKHELEFDKIINYINESVQTYPSIKVLVITGGECFLLEDKLAKIIKHASEKKLFTRVVTNGYWGSTYEFAIKKLTPIVEAGLTEINFSTGDNHQEFVKFEYVVNATKAACDLGIKNICISIECSPNSSFKESELVNNAILYPLIKNGKVKYVNASWMSFVEDFEYNYKLPSYFLDQKRPCINIFKGITINPYSQLLSCCGLTVEYNEYLKLGNLEQYSIKELYENQFNDLLKFWLYTDGPEFIYELIMEKRGLKKRIFPHECAYCIELVRNAENENILRELIKKELPNIIYRFKSKNITI